MLVAAPSADAKDYAIDEVEIEARIEPDGTLVVREWRTLTFSGDFSRVYWELDEKASEGIVVIGASGPEGALALTDDRASRPPGTYAVTDQGDITLVEVFFRLADTSARLGIEYRALGAARRWDDTGELFWQLVGPGWGVPTGRLRATVAPPPGVTGDEVRAWATRPLWGTVTMSPTASSRSVDDLPAETFVEVRELFPRAAIPRTKMDGPRVAVVLEEEGRWAEGRTRSATRPAGDRTPPSPSACSSLSRDSASSRSSSSGMVASTVRASAASTSATCPIRPRAPGRRAHALGQGEGQRCGRHAPRPGEPGRHRHRPRHRRGQGPLRRKTERSYKLTLKKTDLGGLRPLEAKLVDFLFNDMVQENSFTVDELRDVARRRGELPRRLGIVALTDRARGRQARLHRAPGHVRDGRGHLRRRHGVFGRLRARRLGQRPRCRCWASSPASHD
jgi:hypothetical protein